MNNHQFREFPPDRGCDITHSAYPDKPLIAYVTPSPDVGIRYLVIAWDHHEQSPIRTECIYGPVRVKADDDWRRLQKASKSLGDMAAWDSDVTIMLASEPLSHPAPSLDHCADMICGMEERL